MIYGAGEAGKQIYSSLEAINRKVFCFIDDNIQKQNTRLFGKKVISQNTFDKLLKKKNI